jgi:RNA polymerase sigma-70 factor (ECF subfamily)
MGSLDEQDLIQEVWVTLLEDDARQLRQWDPARGATLEGYVGMVTQREFGNASQKASAKKRGGHLVALDEIAEPAKSGPSPEASAIGRDEARRLGDYLAAELPTKGQVVFRCLYTDEMSPDEAAEALGVNRQVVYNWQHKIRQLARAFMSPAGA